jgi:hypothetical protein
MTQVRAEDVVSKINAAKVTTAGRVRTKVPVGAAQARWEALQPRSSGAGVLIAEAPTGPQAGRGTREEAIVISSNESDAEVEKPIESDEFKGKDGREIVGGDGGDGDETEDEEERIPATAEAGVDASSKQPSASVSVTDDAADGSARSASVGRGRGRFMAKRGGHGRH